MQNSMGERKREREGIYSIKIQFRWCNYLNVLLGFTTLCSYVWTRQPSGLIKKKKLMQIHDC